jgi:predicted small secreted protein
VGTALAAIWLIGTISLGGWEDPWIALRLAGAIVVIAALAAILRFAVSGLEPAAPVLGPDAVDFQRNRIAPMIVLIGTAGIGVVAAVLIGIIGYRVLSKPPEVDPQSAIQTMQQVFASVVPVFATWVGAVIAFYFTNESYRTASKAATLKIDDGDAPLAAPPVMIPYDKITKLVLGGQVTLQPGGAAVAVPNAAGDIGMDLVRQLLVGDTISRVVIFDQNKVPQYIIRKRLDANLAVADGVEPKVSDYLAVNDADAKNFQFRPRTATVADGRSIMKLFGTADIFITEHGSATEPVIGWVTDTNLG